MDESFEVDLLRVNLESMTSMNADTVNLLCNQLRTVKLGNDNAMQTSAVIQEMSNRYTKEEITKILSNEFFFESTGRKIIEKLEFEKDRKLKLIGREKLHRRKLRLRTGSTAS